jgi:predicted ribosomally synthesized peptide with SipW-like signal peptide
MKKLGFIALAVVLALGVLGVGFALWSQQLTITGTVETGTLLVGIRDTGTNDPPPDLTTPPGVVKPIDPPNDGTIDEGYDKNVGAIESINGKYKFTKDNVDYYHDITYKITNAYPCYTGTGSFAVANGGTIPVKVKTIKVTGGNIDEITFKFAGVVEGQQIEPCTVVRGTVSFHVEQVALENTTYTITVEMDFWQWNEA